MERFTEITKNDSRLIISSFFRKTTSERRNHMPRQSIFDMKFSNVFPLLIQKAERKNRTRDEVYEVTAWLTGYTPEQIGAALGSEISYGTFFTDAPSYNPRAGLIKGKICGVQVETIDDPLMKKIRQLDKLVDELAKGKTMEKILRLGRAFQTTNMGYIHCTEWRNTRGEIILKLRQQTELITFFLNDNIVYVFV